MFKTRTSQPSHHEDLILYSICLIEDLQNLFHLWKITNKIDDGTERCIYSDWWCKNSITLLISKGHWQNGRKQNRQIYVILFFNIIYQKSIRLNCIASLYQNLHVSCVNNKSISLTLHKNSMRFILIHEDNIVFSAPILRTI